MGKNWLNCVSVSCLSKGKDKKHQKSEKEKKKLYEKQKSRESIEIPLDETPPIDLSFSSVPQPSPPPPPPPPLPDIAPQLLLPPPSPPPPPLPDIAPQPSLPPPSPPPPPPPLLLPSSSARNTGYGNTKEAKTHQALALATAVAAEAAVVAAHAAAEVLRLTTTSPNQIQESKEEAAAIKIQNAFRGYKARRTLRMLQGMARLKTLLQGKYVKRQMNAMLSSMQTLTRLQIQIQDRRNRLFEENKARHRLLQQKGHQKEQHQNQNLVLEGDFDSSNKSKKQIEARFASRKEATVRRERALAYAYSHQQTWRNSSKLPHQTLMDPNTPHWGWSWLERWMASRPWDAQSNDHQASLKRKNSIKSSPARSKTNKSASQSSFPWPISHDSKNIKNEGMTNRRHSTGGGSSTSVKDNESVGSSLSRKSSFGNTQTDKSKVSVETTSNAQTVKKSKAIVGTTRNLDNTQALRSKVSMGTTGNLPNTQTVKTKVNVGTTGNLANTQAVKSKVNVGTTDNMGLQKKRVVTDNKKPPEMVLSKKSLSSSTSLGATKKLSDSDKATTTGAVNGDKKRRNGGSS